MHTNMQCNATGKQDRCLVKAARCVAYKWTHKLNEGTSASSRTDHDQNNVVTVSEISPARGDIKGSVCARVLQAGKRSGRCIQIFLLLAVEHSYTMTGSKGAVESSAVRPTHKAPTHRSARQQPVSTLGGVGGFISNSRTPPCNRLCDYFFFPLPPLFSKKFLHVLCSRDLGGC